MPISIITIMGSVYSPKVWAIASSNMIVQIARSLEGPILSNRQIWLLPRLITITKLDTKRKMSLIRPATINTPSQMVTCALWTISWVPSLSPNLKSKTTARSNKMATIKCSNKIKLGCLLWFPSRWNNMKIVKKLWLPFIWTRCQIRFKMLTPVKDSAGVSLPRRA